MRDPVLPDLKLRIEAAIIAALGFFVAMPVVVALLEGRTP